MSQNIKTLYYSTSASPNFDFLSWGDGPMIQIAPFRPMVGDMVIVGDDSILEVKQVLNIGNRVFHAYCVNHTHTKPIMKDDLAHSHDPTSLLRHYLEQRQYATETEMPQRYDPDYAGNHLGHFLIDTDKLTEPGGWQSEDDEQ